ncbi:hepatic lectin-like [Penaeus japonicus]|uniref:hepatic lectin-like n=1 Tax=Penaeus japonicus TaxID=27405 RepID=UPI001C711FE6|nr:hepatic lectin-like [Penaeus japonicus]
MRSPVVFAWSLLILHGILAVSGISQMYVLMGRDFGARAKSTYRKLGTMHKFTCGFKCLTDGRCKGFVHTIKGECNLLATSFFTVMSRRSGSWGAKMYWKIGSIRSFWRYGDSFFMSFKVRLYHHTCTDICKFFKGTIVVPENSEENEFISSRQGQTWLGIRRVNGIFVNQYTGAPLNYTNWKDGEPAFPSGNEDCALMNSEGLWENLSCRGGSLLICQKKITTCWGGYEDQRCFIFTHR